MDDGPVMMLSGFPGSGPAATVTASIAWAGLITPREHRPNAGFRRWANERRRCWLGPVGC